MSFLLFNYDQSHSSIGGDAGVIEHLGLPPLTMTGGVDTFKERLQRVFRPMQVAIEHPIIGKTGDTETRIVPNEKGQAAGMQGICVDTITRLAEYELQAVHEMQNDEREAEGEEPLQTLTRSWWGQYGDRMTRLFRMVSKVNATVVCTAHEGINTDDVGRRFHGINMKGSASDKVPEYFDVVGYLRVEGSGTDARRFIQLSDSTAYPQAKDRKNILPSEITFVEDEALHKSTLATIVKSYRENGTEHPKILLIGQSGTGKTLLLRTLAPLLTPTPEPVAA